MEAKERIKKSLIQLQRKSPFFTYLSLFMKFHEVVGEEEEEIKTMGIDLDANVYYSKKFVDSIDDKGLLFVVAHELFHLVFLTEARMGNRDRDGFNFASDLIINTILREQGFREIKDIIIADTNDIYSKGDFVIKNVSKKSAEELYDELPKIKSKEGYYFLSNGTSLGKIIDKHIKSKRKSGKGLTEADRRDFEKKWKERISEALIHSQMKGNVPRGLERFIDKLHEEEIDWRSLLQRYLIQRMPYDYCFSKPHRKSIPSGFYMPSVTKEGIDVVIGIDVSGSIGDKELADFLSEIIGLARAYQEQISMTIYTHETDVVGKWKIENGSIDDIKNIKIDGGGGTAHKRLFERIKKDIKDCKVCVFLTDGYSELNEINFNEYSFDKLFVISKGGSKHQLKNKNCSVIELKNG